MTKSATFTALLIGIVFCFLLIPEVARPDAVYLGGISTHIASPDSQYNQSHDLIAYERNVYLVGRFKNSYNRTSYVAAKGWHEHRGYLRLSLFVGGVYGYRSCYGDEGTEARLCPMLAPSATYTRWRVQPSVFLFGEALVLSARVEI